MYVNVCANRRILHWDKKQHKNLYTNTYAPKTGANTCNDCDDFPRCCYWEHCGLSWIALTARMFSTVEVSHVYAYHIVVLSRVHWSTHIFLCICNSPLDYTNHISFTPNSKRTKTHTIFALFVSFSFDVTNG